MYFFLIGKIRVALYGIFSDKTSCRLIEIYTRFGRMYCRYLQDRTSLLLGPSSDHEIAGYTIFRNVSKILPDNTTFHSRLQYSLVFWTLWFQKELKLSGNVWNVTQMLLIRGLETVVRRCHRDCSEVSWETGSQVVHGAVTALGTHRASVMKQLLRFVAAWPNSVAYGPLPLHRMMTHGIMCRFSSSVSFFFHRIKSCCHSSSFFNLLTRLGCDI